MLFDHGEAELTVDLDPSDQMICAEEALGLAETTVGSFLEQWGAKAAWPSRRFPVWPPGLPLAWPGCLRQNASEHIFLF